MRGFLLLRWACCLAAFCCLACLPERIGTSSEGGVQAPHKTIRVGLALSHYGLGDQSFNDMLYNGFIQAYIRYEMDAVLRIAEDIPDGERDKYFSAFFESMILKDQCNVIIAGEGYQMGAAMYGLALMYTDVVFIVFEYDSQRMLPNLVKVEFAQNEGSFVAGFLAARQSKTKKVAFLGGVDLASVKDFQSGFSQGVRYGDPACVLVTEYVTRVPDFSGFNDPEKGNAIARRLYDQGADIIYSVAGGTGNGIIQAAREAGAGGERYVIGVDSDQDHMAPGLILTSMMKNLDHAVLTLIGDHVRGELQSGTRRFTYKERGVGLSKMEYTREKFSAGFLEELYEVEEMVKNGLITVSDTLKK